MTKEQAIKYLQQLYPNGGHCWLDEQRIEAIGMAVKALQEEPVSIWHDASEEPKPNMELICVGQYGNPLVLSSNSDSFKSRDISKWAYFNDLLNLSNVQRTVKNWKEPVSEDLEEEPTIPDIVDEHYWEMLGEESVSDDLEKVVEEIVDPTVLNAYGVKEIANRLRRTMIDSVSDDLGEYINKLSKQFPEVSFAKLSRIAVRVAKWQKQQDQSTIELAEDHAMLAGMEKMKEDLMAKAKGGTVQEDYQIIMDDGTYIDLDPSMSLKPSLAVKEGERIKVIVIKED